MPEYEEDSDQIPENRLRNINSYKIRRLERKVDDYEKRIRVLEDHNLTMVTTHKNMVKWITIAAACFSAVISFLEHILLK